MAEKKEAPVESQVPATSTGTVPVPSYIKEGTARGAENVTVKDIAFPRIQIAQSMSPCMKSSDAAYIPGIQEGDIYNTLTRENYGQDVVVVPVYFEPLYTCWRTRVTGGGFRGSFKNETDAAARIQQGTQNGEQIEIVETHQHLVLVLVKDRIEQALISMSRTQLKKSKQWNSLMRLAGGDIFSHSYSLTTITESNQRGTYKNWNAAPIAFAPEKAYLEAEELYGQVTSGTVNIVASDDSGSGPTDY